jgi:hypothetical protein
VLLLSFLAATVVVALTILNFTLFRDRNTTVQSVLSCIIGLTIPVVGWLGAKAANRNLIGAFCLSSISCAIFNLISYIIVMVGLSLLDHWLSECQPDGTVVINGEINTTICSDYSHDEVRDMYIIATCISIPVIILQCLGGVYGNVLYRKLTPDFVVAYEADPYPRGQLYSVTTVNPVIVTVPAAQVPASKEDPPTLYPSV